VLYFTYLPRSPPWVDLHQIWHRASSRGRNHVCKMFLSIGLEVSILYGVKICHSPLTKPVAVNTVQSPVIIIIIIINKRKAKTETKQKNKKIIIYTFLYRRGYTRYTSFFDLFHLVPHPFHHKSFYRALASRCSVHRQNTLQTCSRSTS